MPIYEYICRSCEREFEELSRAMAEQPSPACPTCGSDDVERRVSVFAAGQRTSGMPQAPVGGGCGRCGDPNGPCSA